MKIYRLLEPLKLILHTEQIESAKDTVRSLKMYGLYENQVMT